MTKQINSDIIATAFDAVFEFNDISGQFDRDLVAGVDLQLDLIWEEYTEALAEQDEALSDAREKSLKDCEVGLLGEAVDLFVVVVGLLQKLQSAGMNVEEALQRVTNKNLSKFPTVINAVDMNWYEKQGWKTFYNEKYSKFVLKDSNGKSRKPIDFEPVVLADLTPGNFYGEDL